MNNKLKYNEILFFLMLRYILKYTQLLKIQW